MSKFKEFKEIKVDEFTVGTTILLYYKAKRNSQVKVDFCGDKKTDKEESRDILLHFNPRYDQTQSCLVLNTQRAGGDWEQEERPPGFPNQPDKDIHVTIVAERDGFVINYDGQRFCYKFMYRMPLENIRSIKTDNEDNRCIKLGYRMTNCQPGKKIYVEVDAPRKVKADTPHKVKADAPHKVKADTPHEVKADAPGEVKADASREVNTDDSQDFDRARNHFGADIYGNDAWKICMDGQPGVFRAIYINARFDEDCVVRNAHIVTAKDGPGKWKKEERDGKMPIKSEETFILCVTFQTNSFEIAFNGWHFATYRYQTQLTPGPITTMLLSMIPYVRRIKYV